MSTTDQNFNLPSQGQSDWDSDLNSNFTIIGRGYHALVTAGSTINTGTILAITSDGYAHHYNPNSTSIRPSAFAYKAISSGEQDTALLHGIIRSLDVLTPAVPGLSVFGSAAGDGYIASSYSGADRPVGIGIYQDGIYFDPGRAIFPEVIIKSAQVAAVTGSTHYFSLDGGRAGFIRRVLAVGASADLVEIQFFSNSARTDLLFETISGGVSVVGSFIDQAGLPYFNTDASTINGLMYGALQVLSASAVGSDTIDVSVTFERFR